MSNKDDIQYLLKMVDKLMEMRGRYKDNKRVYDEISVARQCVYDCAMDIPFKEADGNE